MKTKTILRKRVQFKSDKPSKTQQHLKNECDVNSILERYRKTGTITHVKKSSGMYGDFSKYSNFQENLNIVKDAYELFDNLPSQIRKKFDNDPSELINYLQDPKNHEEAIQHGLLNPKPESKKSEAPLNDDKTTKKEPQISSGSQPQV